MQEKLENVQFEDSVYQGRYVDWKNGKANFF